MDKENDLVALDAIEVAKASFPSDPANADAYVAALRQRAASGLRTISLARLQSSLAVAEAETGAKALAVKNDPPKIIYSQTPAMLVLIDGKPRRASAARGSSISGAAGDLGEDSAAASTAEADFTEVSAVRKPSFGPDACWAGLERERSAGPSIVDRGLGRITRSRAIFSGARLRRMLPLPQRLHRRMA